MFILKKIKILLLSLILLISLESQSHSQELIKLQTTTGNAVTVQLFSGLMIVVKKGKLTPKTPDNSDHFLEDGAEIRLLVTSKILFGDRFGISLFTTEKNAEGIIEFELKITYPNKSENRKILFNLKDEQMYLALKHKKKDPIGPVTIELFQGKNKIISKTYKIFK